MRNNRSRWWNHPAVWLLALCVILLASAGCSKADKEPLLTEEQKKLSVESFETVWTTVRDAYHDPKMGGLDWQGVHDELLPKVKKAQKKSEVRAILSGMLSRLELSHFGIVPEDVYSGLKTPGQEKNSPKENEGMTGIDVRIIGGRAMVSSVETGSPAETAGVKAGWVITQVEDVEIAPMMKRIGKQYEKRSTKALFMTYSIKGRLVGDIGEPVTVHFEDLAGKSVNKKLAFGESKGKIFRLGHFPLGYIWFEEKLLDGNIGYVAFNGFLDVGRLMPMYNQAMQKHMNAAGLIIDLRGNGGGLPIMAMGMGGWLVEEKGRYLGTLISRRNTLKLTILPRPEIFTGPVAVLVDELSASCSEFFAAGLKDIGRARIFGATTAGAALPSIIKKLPNGDGLQYAVADYRRANGKELEGVGVIPDEKIPLTHDALLKGKDSVLEAASRWIQSGAGKDQ